MYSPTGDIVGRYLDCIASSSPVSIAVWRTADERRNSPRLSRNYDRDDRRELVSDPLDLRESGRLVAARNRPEIPPSVDRWPAASRRLRGATRSVQQTLPRVWNQALTVRRTTEQKTQLSLVSP